MSQPAVSASLRRAVAHAALASLRRRLVERLAAEVLDLSGTLTGD